MTADLLPILPILLALTACDTEIGTVGDRATVLDQLACIDHACAYLPACSPVAFKQWRAWDWRTEVACRRTFVCGQDPDACAAAVDALPCLLSGASPEWLEDAHAEGVARVREACRVVVEQEPGEGPGVGGVVRVSSGKPR